MSIPFLGKVGAYATPGKWGRVKCSIRFALSGLFNMMFFIFCWCNTWNLGQMDCRMVIWLSLIFMLWICHQVICYNGNFWIRIFTTSSTVNTANWPDKYLSYLPNVVFTVLYIVFCVLAKLSAAPAKTHWFSHKMNEQSNWKCYVDCLQNKNFHCHFLTRYCNQGKQCRC